MCSSGSTPQRLAAMHFAKGAWNGYAMLITSQPIDKVEKAVEKRANLSSSLFLWSNFGAKLCSAYIKLGGHELIILDKNTKN